MESIGKYLKETRESKNISVEKAAKESKIGLEHLQQIEADQFNQISGMTYIKGFLKQYGEYLGLDGKVLIDEYIKIYGKEDKSKDKISLISSYQRMELSMLAFQKWAPIIRKIILVIILSAIIYGAIKTMPSVVAPIKNMIKINFKKTTTTTEKKEKQKTKSSILNDIEAIEQKSSSQKKLRTTEINHQGVLSAVTVEKAASSDKNIEIKATTNVWLTIKIGDTLIMDGLLEAGETEKFADDKPVHITANNPANVSVLYRKKEIQTFKDSNSHSILKIADGEVIIEN